MTNNKNKPSKPKYDEMRETKTVDWCGRSITVREIIASEVISLTKKELKPGTSDQQVIINFVGGLCKICTGIEVKELIEYPPSKIKQLIKHIEEVNEGFFWIMASFGLSRNVIMSSLETVWRNFIAMESLNVFKS